MKFKAGSGIKAILSRLSGSVVLLVISGVAMPVSAQIEEVNEDGVRIIRQGGYVEKVDPSVDYKDRLPRIPPREPWCRGSTGTARNGSLSDQRAR